MKAAGKVALVSLAAVSMMAVPWTTSVGAAATTRTVKVKMVDIAFEPATLNAAVGEKIRFVFSNRGKADHDAFIGATEAQAKHERKMRKDDNQHGGHGDGAADALTVKPDKRATLTYTFKKAGTLEIGCHEPGHYAAGMRVVVTVV